MRCLFRARIPPTPPVSPYSSTPDYDLRRRSWADADLHEDDNPQRPRILVVTPEITYLPSGMGNLAQRMCAKAGGLADVSASLVKALYDQGADVHVALPNYRRMFDLDGTYIDSETVSRVLLYC